MYTPFDYNEAIGHKKEYIEDKLREGSPVVGLTYEGGILLLTLRRTQRKIYEIYDRQVFSAIGFQADIENVRLSAIQYAHQEGFDRSPDDVTLHRMVGFALSPAIKKAFGDQWTAPFVVRGLFAELGHIPSEDVFFTLNYDGEFRQHIGAAVLAGLSTAEDRMLERIGEPMARRTQEEALRTALAAWIVGARTVIQRRIGQKDEEEDLPNPLRDIDEAEADTVFLRDELKTGTLEAAVLERRNQREHRFRLLTATELGPLIP